MAWIRNGRQWHNEELRRSAERRRGAVRQYSAAAKMSVGTQPQGLARIGSDDASKLHSIVMKRKSKTSQSEEKATIKSQKATLNPNKINYKN